MAAFDYVIVLLSFVFALALTHLLSRVGVCKRRCCCSSRSGSQPTLSRCGSGALTSTQYTAMNTLAYADVPDTDASNASSIASNFQQLSVSFGVAAAGLTTVFFVPDRLRGDSSAVSLGLHQAFLALGAFTILSVIVFAWLKRDDGANETRQKDIHLG
jgi:hypothetical protein